MMKTYYIKDKIVFSSDVRSYEIPALLGDIKITRDTKNYLTSNKIIITDIEKLGQKKGKELELSIPIENFNEIKQKLINSKKKKKPLPDNYDFMEKTSVLQIIDGIIGSFSNEKAEELRGKLESYLRLTREEEKKTNADLSEQIEIEESKLKKILNEKKKYHKENIEQVEKQLNKSLTLIKKLQDEKHRLEEKIGVDKDKKIEPNALKIKEKINSIDHQVKNNELEIKILKAKIVSLKSEMRLGKTKCINWILFVLSLGLIYWTRYSDCRYHLLRLEQKINKLTEKNLVFDKKKYNLDNELDREASKDSKSSVERAKEAENIVNKIEELELAINKEESVVKNLEKELKQKERGISKYEKDVSKFEGKLIELESINEEFMKYSCEKIEKKLEEVISLNREKIKAIEELKIKIESQKTQIEGDWIIEV